jgi:hypothetical protein
MHDIDDEASMWPQGISPAQQEQCYLRHVSRLNGNPIKNRTELLETKAKSVQAAGKRKVTLEAKRRAAAAAAAAGAEAVVAEEEKLDASDNEDNLSGFAGFTRI